MTDTRTVKNALLHAANWFPDREALTQPLSDPELRRDYSTLNDRACRTANGLADLGVGPGDRVAFLSKSTVAHTTAYLSLAKIGAIGVPVHARESPRTIDRMLAAVDPSVLFFHPDYTESVTRLDYPEERAVELVVFDRNGHAPDFATAYSTVVDRGDGTEPDVKVDPSDPAYINFTSGTTGRTKGIVHTHEEVIESAQMTQYSSGIQSTDVCLNARSPSFIGWSIHQFPLINTAARTVFLEEWDPASVARVIEQEAVTLLTLTPTQWKMVLETSVDEYDLSSIRKASFAGESMSPSVLRELKDQVTEKVSTAYGSTETMGSGTRLATYELTEATVESIGKPMPNVEARVIDPDSHDPSAEVEDGEKGELIIRGPSVAKSVWNEEAVSDPVFHEDGWWFSGDVARRDEDGYLYLFGRSDNMINSGGINIHAESVEHALEGHPDVIEAAVVGVPHDRWNEAVKAFVVARDASLDAATLDEWWRGNDALADYRRPRSYEFTDSLPRTPTGKLDRSGLRPAERA